jgi:hypothetical protein
MLYYREATLASLAEQIMIAVRQGCDCNGKKTHVDSGLMALLQPDHATEHAVLVKKDLRPFLALALDTIQTATGEECVRLPEVW